MRSPATRTGAVVRKPSGKEPAGCRGQRCRGVYGDFATAVEAAAVDEVADGVNTAPNGGGDEAGVARQQGAEAGLGLAERGLGRAPSRPVLDRRDTSARQRGMRVPGAMGG